ncbi:hypothetical protein Tco_1372243 [Tanacetum coccineum]
MRLSTRRGEAEWKGLPLLLLGTGLGSGPRHQDTIIGDRPAQTRFDKFSKQSNKPPLLRVNTHESVEDSMKLMELIKLCTKLSERVLALENIKTAQALEITNLKKRVKRMEKKKKSRTSHLKIRLFRVMIESSAKKSLVNTASTSITTASINITTAEPVTTINAPVTIVGISVSTAEPSTPPIASHNCSDPYENEKGVIIKEASETTTRPTVPPQQQLDRKDKGKGKMVEPEKLLKKKDQIKFDKELAQRLLA